MLWRAHTAPSKNDGGKRGLNPAVEESSSNFFHLYIAPQQMSCLAPRASLHRYIQPQNQAHLVQPEKGWHWADQPDRCQILDQKSLRPFQYCQLVRSCRSWGPTRPLWRACRSWPGARPLWCQAPWRGWPWPPGWATCCLLILSGLFSPLIFTEMLSYLMPDKMLDSKTLASDASFVT